MTKIERVENYLNDFFTYNFYDFKDFYRTTYDQRNEGVYRLEKGAEIMDYINHIQSNVEENLDFPKLVPHRFATPEKLLFYLNALNKFVLHEGKFIDEMFKENENCDYILSHIFRYKDNLSSAIQYAVRLYDLEDENYLLYQRLRFHLINTDIDSFILDLKSIFSNVSYAIARESEGYYHANVFLILKLLGFDIVPEETTNIGRIDAVIRFSDKIYIIEFKFSEGTDDSDEAFEQIINKEYASKYRIEGVKIFGIGISFNSTIRNIRQYKFEEI